VPRSSQLTIKGSWVSQLRSSEHQGSILRATGQGVLRSLRLRRPRLTWIRLASPLHARVHCLDSKTLPFWSLSGIIANSGKTSIGLARRLPSCNAEQAQGVYLDNMDIEAGQRIGNYEIVRKLGAGGLGMVYEARHSISGRAEAMKVLLPSQTGTVEMVERFRREVQLLATLNHPNIASLHNAFYHQDQLIMVMELVHGETLRERSRRVPIPLPTLQNYASQILSALAFAHQAGVVHRDIKPSNVMITEQDVVKLLDFGIAISDRSIGLTTPGFLLGSLSYMSPEQLNGEKATARSDIYSVAVTLYEVLTGQLPFTGATNYEIMMAHLQRTPVPPASLNAAIAPAVSNAIMRALAKNPLERFATAGAFHAALQDTSATLEQAPLQQRSVPTPVAVPANATTPTLERSPSLSPNVQKTAPESTAALPLEELTTQLAVFIGPVAKFVVKKLAGQYSDLDQLYAQAAKQIPVAADREKFLRSRRRKT
jgi:serine/threonine protein kinase